MEAKRSAIVQFEQALKLFRFAGDRSQEVLTLKNIGAAYKDLGEQQKAFYDRKALEASERSRSRSLLELLQETNANIREGISPDLLQQEKSLQQQLDAIEKQRIEAVSRPNPNPTQVDAIDSGRLALLQQSTSV